MSYLAGVLSTATRLQMGPRCAHLVLSHPIQAIQPHRAEGGHFSVGFFHIQSDHHLIRSFSA
jgi:hypothetical protein